MIDSGKKNHDEVDVGLLLKNLTRKYHFQTKRDYGSYIVLDDGYCMKDGIQYGCRAEIILSRIVEYKVHNISY